MEPGSMISSNHSRDKSSEKRKKLACTMSTRRILLIGGSDSSGGAGLEADQKVVAAHCMYAMTATTALTAQNTKGISAVQHTPPDFVKQQIDAVCEDIGVDVVKTGMLASAPTIKVVAAAIRNRNIGNVIVDPVMTSTSGAQLLPPDAVKTLREELLPITTVLTPNIPEAELILSDIGQKPPAVSGIDSFIKIAKALHELGPKYVLLKGGHVPLTMASLAKDKGTGAAVIVDVLYGAEGPRILQTDYIDTDNTHGTGCSLATAIACGIAAANSIPRSVRNANRYVEAAVRTNIPLGKGYGPVNHFHSSYKLPFPPGKFLEYLLEREDVSKVWRDFTHHEFVKRMGDGTLHVNAFREYLIQDYLYLVQYARAHALASYKAKNLQEIGLSASMVRHIENEVKMHMSFCETYGLTKAEVENSEESQACTAYTRYMLDVGQSEDWIALQVVIMPCLVGYRDIARKIHDDPKTVREGNRYWKWVLNYVSNDFSSAVNKATALVEKHAVRQSPQRIEELAKIFLHSTRMEIGFWNMPSLKTMPKTYRKSLPIGKSGS